MIDCFVLLALARLTNSKNNFQQLIACLKFALVTQDLFSVGTNKNIDCYENQITFKLLTEKLQELIESFKLVLHKTRISGDFDSKKD